MKRAIALCDFSVCDAFDICNLCVVCNVWARFCYPAWPDQTLHTTWPVFDYLARLCIALARPSLAWYIIAKG